MSAADANGNGVLSFEEFIKSLVCAVEPRRTHLEVLRMFRETLDEAGDMLSPEAFAGVARAHGLQPSPEVLWRVLGETWNGSRQHFHDTLDEATFSAFDRTVSQRIGDSAHAAEEFSKLVRRAAMMALES